MRSISAIPRPMPIAIPSARRTLPGSSRPRPGCWSAKPRRISPHKTTRPGAATSRAPSRPASLPRCQRRNELSPYFWRAGLLTGRGPAGAGPSTNHPAPMAAKKKHKFTIGIEEEFQIVDPISRELRSHIEEILEGGKMILKERVRPELHQSVVEIGTDICEDIAGARKSVTGLRSDLAKLARTQNLAIA